MARKPLVTPPKSPAARSHAAKAAAAPTRTASGGEAVLRRELAAARTRIAELEAKQADLSKRIEAAIAAIHKILDI